MQTGRKAIGNECLRHGEMAWHREKGVVALVSDAQEFRHTIVVDPLNGDPSFVANRDDLFHTTHTERLAFRSALRNTFGGIQP